MRIHSLGYLIKEGIKSLWKNRTMSIASIGVLISCLLLTGAAGLLTINLSIMMKSVEGNNSIRVILDEKTPRLQSIQIGEDLKKISNIKDVEFVSKEDALDQVIEMLEKEGRNTDLLKTDPDGSFMPDAYHISMKDLSIYQQTTDQIMSIEGVSTITDYSNIANKLSNLDRLVRYASIGIFIILGVVSLFIISNTIKVTMFSRRMEINIMKSVGATNLFVRIPFIVEGILIGVLSGAISATIVYKAYDQMAAAVSSIASFIEFIKIDRFAVLIYLAYIGMGMLFGIVAGGISIGKYLRNEGEKAII